MKKLIIPLLAAGILLMVVGCGTQHEATAPANQAGKLANGGTILNQGSLGDMVWLDSDCNGIQNEGEFGVPDVTVKLLTCQDSLLMTTETDSTGHYLFNDLAAGQYIIQFVLPEHFAFSPMDQGLDDAVDSDADSTGKTVCITLDSAEVDLTWDAGLCALEEQGCTFSHGYWKNHAGFGPQDDVVTPLLPILLGLPDSSASLNVTTAQIAYDVLRMRTYGVPSNGITKLYAQFLAAKLNMANGANGDDIAEAIVDANIFLSTHDWHSWDTLSREQKQMVLSLMGQFGAYNEGMIGPGHCNEDDENMK